MSAATERVLAEVAKKVRTRKSRYSIAYDMEVLMERAHMAQRAGGGSTVATRARLIGLAALCVAAIAALDAPAAGGGEG